jgi:phage terminase large subunit-like protein
VQTAAVSKDQTKNTMTLFAPYFSKAAIAEYEIDLGKEIIYAHHGAQRIEAVTSSPNTLEGARATFVLMNETHHWLSTNEGHEMAAVISRNAAKSPDGAARSLAITNAYEPGEDSVAQQAREAYEDIAAGRYADVGFLYDSIEAPPDATLDPATLPETLDAIRGNAYWLDIPRIIQEIMDKRNPPSRSRRFWLNQIVATEDAWVTPQEWDVLANKDTLKDGDQITLGFDGSKSDDQSALMACRISDGFVARIGIWDPESPMYAKRPQRFRDDIDAAVRQSFERYDVVGFFSDVHPWESYITQWNTDLGTEKGHELCVAATRDNRIGWDMRARQKDFTLNGAEWTHDEILEKGFHHDGDKLVRQHVMNARRRPNAWGVSFGKEHRESNRKIDALPALILARMARKAYLALPERKRRRKRRGAAFF